MRGLQTEIERRPGMGRADARAMANRLREQLHQFDRPVDAAYNQLLFIEHGQNEAALSIYPLLSTTHSAATH